MSGFTVDLAAVLAAVADLEAYDSALQQHLDDLEQTVQSLHAVWEGEAAQAHKMAHEEWARGAAEMRQAAARMRDVLAQVHANHSQAQQANVTMWGRF